MSDDWKSMSVEDFLASLPNDVKDAEFIMNCFQRFVDHFADPVFAAEQDLVGQMIDALHDMSASCRWCKGTGYGVKLEDERLVKGSECQYCRKARAILARTKEPRP